MKEEDDIANFINNSQVESFDIKQEWLDNMSTQLDAYNAEKAAVTRKKWWFTLLLIPVIIFPVFWLSDTKVEHSPTITTQETNNTVLIEKSLNDHAFKKSNASTPIPNDHTSDLTFEKTAITNLDKAIPPVEKSNNNTLNPAANKQVSKAKNKAIKNKKQLNPQPKSSGKIAVKPMLNHNSKSDQIASKKKTLDSEDQLITQKDNVEVDPVVDNTFNPALQNLPDAPSTVDSTSSPSKTEQQYQDSNPVPNVVEYDSEKAETPIETAEQFATNPEIKTAADTSILWETQAIAPAALDSTYPAEIEEQNTDSVIAIAADIKIEGDDYKKPKLWMIGLTLGPDLLSKQLTTSSELQNFEQKKTEELIDNTWGFDFEINRHLTPWLVVGTGIGFKKYQEVNSYGTETFITIDTTYVIEDISFMYKDSTIADSVLIPNFLTVAKTSKDSVVDDSKQVANGTVSSSYIQIPINVQLIFLNKKKFNAYTNLGLTAGLLTNNSGLVVDYNTNEIVNYTTRKMIFSSSVGLGVNYNLIGPLDFKLYGAYRFNLTNFSLTPNVEKRYNGYQFRTGLVFHF
ncbi:hypothetical protein DNU06_03180 [Putridiphycobacter roseus]|uniref:Outer membrane protein beta-barrel domain-containing protein n=1 Tax=Putridiphycobacter roseus TaxID=2219161 RepID=A0A2W1NVL8_9FLAO|nr:PorT family protein [Putridiphycobacter roseus]PZE18848.1 hypothetical protein DNU06_03180 [Putridiphycobacter roseus]